MGIINDAFEWTKRQIEATRDGREPDPAQGRQVQQDPRSARTQPQPGGYGTRTPDRRTAPSPLDTSRTAAVPVDAPASRPASPPVTDVRTRPTTPRPAVEKGALPYGASVAPPREEFGPAFRSSGGSDGRGNR